MISFSIFSGSARRIAAAVCSCILCAVLCFTSLADTEYEAKPFYWNLYANNEVYGGTIGGVEIAGASGRFTDSSFSVPLNLNSSFKYLLIGASYRTSVYDVGATYKMVISITTGATGSYSGACPFLYSSNLKAVTSTLIDNKNKSLVSQKGVMTTGSGNTYTFTFDNIPYDSVVGSTFFFTSFLLSNFSSVNDELYVVQSYFGLSSYYDEDLYNSQMLENLGAIQGKLDGIEDAVDNAGDQISGAIGDLENSIVTQHVKEEEYADEKGSDSVDDVNGSLDDSGLTPSIDSMWTGLKRLFSCISTTDTVTSFPIPEIKIPVLEGTGFDTEIVLVEAQNYDFSQILNNPSIQTLIKVTKVLYYLFFFYFMVDYIRKLLAKLFLTDVVTNEGSAAKKEENSKHG